MNYLRRALLFLAIALTAGFDSAAAADRRETVAWDGGLDRDGRVVLPAVLSAADAALYRRIFGLGETGDWAAADALIERLADRLLLGHVLAQRYLHPAAYSSRRAELAAWLDAYPDHPDAERIRDLAAAKLRDERRTVRPAIRTAKRPPRIVETAPPRPTAAPRPKRRNGFTAEVVTPEDAPRAVADGYAGIPGLYAAVAAPADGRRWQVGGTVLPGVVPAGWRSSGLWGSPEALWRQGLAAWRAGDTETAAETFESLAERDDVSEWMTSAAAFWAARARLHARQPQYVHDLLRRSADRPRTFYGLLARRILGLPPTFRWRADEADVAALRELRDHPAGVRALALIEAGQPARAEAELAAAARADRGRYAHGAMVVAERAGLARLSLQLAERLYPDGGGLDAAAYPVPYWRPQGGLTVDPALLFALARQESRFDPAAVSSAGARGLLQVMPGTAATVSANSDLPGTSASRLYDPSTNMAIGQRYIEMLLDEEHVGLDLLRLAAAWNGGPQNLKRWREGDIATDDPLLFLESMPFGQTRAFAERVLAFYWIYRDRFGQEAPSLDSLAAGDWPAYQELREVPIRVAFHDAD
jgi:soluble lytic murein transglycosylase-like protein